MTVAVSLLMSLPPWGARGAAIATRRRPNPPRHEDCVLVALQNAFYQLLLAARFEEGLVDTVAVSGREAIPMRWRKAVLTCRPVAQVGAKQPRPIQFWPVDAIELAEALLATGG